MNRLRDFRNSKTGRIEIFLSWRIMFPSILNLDFFWVHLWLSCKVCDLSGKDVKMKKVKDIRKKRKKGTEWKKDKERY